MLQIKFKETIVPNLEQIKNECNEKLQQVESYILLGSHVATKETNLAVLQEARKNIEKMFKEMHCYIDFTGIKNVEMVLSGISERLELVDLMNDDESMKNEEYFEVLLDLPFSVNRILNLERIATIANMINTRRVDYISVKEIPKEAFKKFNTMEIESKLTTYSKVITKNSPMGAIFDYKEIVQERLLEIA